jgi:CubicO group peptidase (beta-lactamase class C family)
MVTCSATGNNYQYSQLVSDIQSIKQDHNITGLALIIVDKQGITHRLYLGLADRNTLTPVTQSTVFRIGSITKTITVLAALKLAEQGMLDLSAPVSTYLKHPPYKNTFSHLKSITVEQLLENSAGFKDLTNKEFYFKEKYWSLEQSFNYDPNSRTTAWLPGEYYSYSNNSAGIVAKVIESISHQSFEEYVDEHIFTPLNLNYASFFNTEKISEHLATGYNTDGISVIDYWHMLYRAFGAANMRADEMATIVSTLINYGNSGASSEFLKIDSIQRFETPTTTLAARNGLTYGYSLGNYQ